MSTALLNFIPTKLTNLNPSWNFVFWNFFHRIQIPSSTCNHSNWSNNCNHCSNHYSNHFINHFDYHCSHFSNHWDCTLSKLKLLQSSQQSFRLQAEQVENLNFVIDDVTWRHKLKQLIRILSRSGRYQFTKVLGDLSHWWSSYRYPFRNTKM